MPVWMQGKLLKLGVAGERYKPVCSVDRPLLYFDLQKFEGALRPVHTTNRFVTLSSNTRFQMFSCIHSGIVLNPLHITCMG